MMALSIRQPWAWLIVNGHKDIENRDWPTRFRGWFDVHAAKGMTKEEYDNCHAFIRTFNKTLLLPPMDELKRGGIVGNAEIIDCVKSSKSPWFVGRYGFLIRNAMSWPFQPCRGALGFFNPNEVADETEKNPPKSWNEERKVA